MRDKSGLRGIPPPHKIENDERLDYMIRAAVVYMRLPEKIRYDKENGMEAFLKYAEYYANTEDMIFCFDVFSEGEYDDRRVEVIFSMNDCADYSKLPLNKRTYRLSLNIVMAEKKDEWTDLVPWDFEMKQIHKVMDYIYDTSYSTADSIRKKHESSITTPET